MKLSTLLTQRERLLQQSRLASLAFAYARLADFSARIARARLTGEVALRHAAPEMERYCASLTALEGRQSVIEEHFTDEDLMDLADVVGFLFGEREVERTFRLEEMAGTFLAPLRHELERSGVNIDAPPPLAAPSGDGSHGCPQVDGTG
ncbi:MAG TPA: hypothetical protein VHO24_16625 [Opitutaceae bacterium]|nr:hypothetical protein [Opitutaceae bacterium]